MSTTKQQPERVNINWNPYQKKLKGVIQKYMIKAKIANINPFKKFAWGTAGFPMELLWTYKFYALHPENAACISGVRHNSLKMIETAESMGYSRDLCSYFKTNIGAVENNIDLFQGGVYKPAFIGSTNTICDTHVKWFQIQARHYDVPYFAFDIPSVVSGLDDPRIDEYAIYVVEQFYDFMDFMEREFGKEFPEKRFWKILNNSAELCDLWHEIFDYRKLVPSQMAFQESFAAIFPLVIQPGLKGGIKYFKGLLKGIKDRLPEGEAAMPEGKETYRIMFEGIPMWYRLKFFYELTNHGVIITYEPYTYSFGPKKTMGLPMKETLSEFAKLIMNTPYSYNLDRRIKYFEDIVDEYKLDGIILHSNMSCRPSATNMFDLKNQIQKDKGIPVILMDCDMDDPRAYSEEQIRTRVEGFIELMNQNKKK